MAILLKPFRHRAEGNILREVLVEQTGMKHNDETARKNPMGLSRILGTHDAVVLLLCFRCDRVQHTSK